METRKGVPSGVETGKRRADRIEWLTPDDDNLAQERIALSLIHISEPTDRTRARMPSSA